MKEIHILLIEDNEGDVILTLEALKEGKVKNRVTVINNGWDAWLFLKKEGRYFSVETPDLILLDINLPKLNGKEVLYKIKHDDLLKKIPVVVLTTSSAENDVLDAYNLHANCYITKPVSYRDFADVVHKVGGFWNSTVTLPKNQV
jgi:CheY-like chemotaxis protein